jgi:hypothetical protein
MTGSLFLLAIVVLALLLVGIFASPFFFIPAGVFLLVALFSGPLMAAIGGGGARHGGGVPTTDEASYDPVQEPHTTPGR